MTRRHLLETAGLLGAVASLSLAGAQESTGAVVAKPVLPSSNVLPQWRGFNVLDFFDPNPAKSRPATPSIMFKWIRDWGFDFVRIPMAYPVYLNIDHAKPITAEQVLKFDVAAIDKVQALVYAAHEEGLHVSLCLHRAPGYCINAGFHEPYNLWRDKDALDAFCAHWQMWARRFKHVSSRLISFDLVNEPSWREDMNDQFGKREPLKAEVYHRIAKAATQSIRAIKPDALIIADGNSGGHIAMPELSDLNIAQSCRGYSPFSVSHHKAPWVYKDASGLPDPMWPTKGGENKDSLRKMYAPWFDLVDSGVGVHCGESGCYRETPHGVFLSWFGDVLQVLSEKKIGFALWEFRGDFGVLDSNRKDVRYEEWYGYKLDKKLLALLQNR